MVRVDPSLMCSLTAKTTIPGGFVGIVHENCYQTSGGLLVEGIWIFGPSDRPE